MSQVNIIIMNFFFTAQELDWDRLVLLDVLVHFSAYVATVPNYEVFLYFFSCNLATLDVFFFRLLDGSISTRYIFYNAKR